MRTHRTDLVSFAFGLLFLALAAWWLLAQVLGLVLPPAGWFLAGGLILVGGLGLIGALRSSRYNGRPAPADTPDDTGRKDSAPDAAESAADPLPGPATPDTPTGQPAPVSSARAADPDPQVDRTLDLFGGADETPPPGRQGRDA
ncbi:hypothetical protein SAMN05216284_10934 [Micromonospora sediminimaris]|uniref:Uncharacterized protein n=1 Tax=Micromonospora sediminimaris TaxID=547162 RepID=A0A9W5UY57_9ACTN|nr:hypothetical protein Vse01_52830 [Micromonospora sediminimaris]SFC95208.1 hypothetical protein SAMN05216284_10934 [Micromonospora sediminimaris]